MGVKEASAHTQFETYMGPLTVKRPATSRAKAVRERVELWCADPRHTLEVREPA